MAYTQFLRALLRPLQVYDLKESGPSGGELCALGDALDGVQNLLEEGLREALVPTAQAQGLEKMEALLGLPALGESLARRRETVKGLLLLGGRAMTLSQAQMDITACGIPCLLEEVPGEFRILISFPGLRGEPENFAAKQALIREILPCHLDLEYKLSYLTFGEMDAYGLTWQDAAAYTFHALKSLPDPA